jgi:hypothetical protein
MSLAWLKVFTGESELPNTALEKADLVSYAEAHHVLGQMSHRWRGKTEGKLSEALENAQLRTDFDHRMLAFEQNRLDRALRGTDISPVLLKGAAYVARGMKAGMGRRVADIDILVPEEQLAETEKSLLAAGWAFDEQTANAYDQEYYRKYMHELPPLRHAKRKTITDIHHRLLPRTSRIKIDTGKMLLASLPLDGTRFRTFTPLDLFIHSAVHSFADGSFDTPARSLIELHYLLEELADTDLEWLGERAADVGAATPVGTALWALDALFSDDRAAELRKKYQLPMANGLTRFAIKAKTENIDQAVFAKATLFIRSHFLRMPLTMLIGHLGKKLIRRVLNPKG